MKFRCQSSDHSSKISQVLGRESSSSAAAAALPLQAGRPAFQTADRLVSYSPRYGVCIALRRQPPAERARVLRAAGTRGTSDVLVIRMGGAWNDDVWLNACACILESARDVVIFVRGAVEAAVAPPEFASLMWVQEEAEIAEALPAGLYNPVSGGWAHGDITVAHWLFTAAKRSYDFVWSMESDVRWIGNYGELWNASLAAAAAPDSAFPGIEVANASGPAELIVWGHWGIADAFPSEWYWSRRDTMRGAFYTSYPPPHPTVFGSAMMFGFSSRLATVIYSAAQNGTSAGILELNLGLHATMSRMKIVNPLREYANFFVVSPRQEFADGLYAAWREGGVAADYLLHAVKVGGGNPGKLICR